MTSEYQAGYRDIAKTLESSLDEDLRRAKLLILVMGPRMDGSTPAARLRRELVNRCSFDGITVLAEHAELIRVARKKFGAGHNLVVYEAKLAKLSDLVIIIPDSPGSLAEFGYFGVQAELCSSIVVLFNKEHRATKLTKSYVLEGPGKFSKQNGAAVHFVDYSKVEGIWRKVYSKIQVKRANKVLRTM